MKQQDYIDCADIFRIGYSDNDSVTLREYENSNQKMTNNFNNFSQQVPPDIPPIRTDRAVDVPNNYYNVPVREDTLQQQSLNNSTAANQILATTVAEYKQELKQVSRENSQLKAIRKRNIINTEIGEDNGQLRVLVEYANGAKVYRPTPFITNFPAPIKVLRVDFDGKKPDRNIVAVTLGDYPKNENSKIIFVDRDKVSTGTYLLKQFLDAGVEFGTKAESENSKLLRYKIAALCNNQTDKISIKLTAGWRHDNVFQDSTTCKLNRGFSHKEAPVLDKTLASAELTAASLMTLCKEITQLPRPIDRLTILMFLLFGLCHSLFCKYIDVPHFYLNIVTDGDFPSTVVAAWLQIFNRHTLACLDARKSPEKFQQQISKICDEVIIVDSRIYDGEAQYSKNKLKQNVNWIIGAVNKESSWNDGDKLKAAVAIISNEFRNGNVLNVVLPSFDTFDMGHHRRFLNEQCLEGYIQHLITTVSGNETLFQRVSQQNTTNSRKFDLFQSCFNIVFSLFKSMGGNIFKLLQLPEPIPLNSFFEDSDIPSDEVIEAFVHTVRSGAVNYYSDTKMRDTTLRPNTFYVSSEVLCFPCQMLCDLFHAEHKDSVLSRALPVLRASGDLETDGETILTKKMSFAGQRVKCYVLRRDLINRPGYVDITILTKSEQNEVKNNDS